MFSVNIATYKLIIPLIQVDCVIDIEKVLLLFTNFIKFELISINYYYFFTMKPFIDVSLCYFKVTILPLLLLTIII